MLLEWAVLRKRRCFSNSNATVKLCVDLGKTQIETTKYTKMKTKGNNRNIFKLSIYK